MKLKFTQPECLIGKLSGPAYNPCSSWGVVEDKCVTLSFYEFTSSLRDSGEVSKNKPLFKSFSELQWQLGKLTTTDMYLSIYIANNNISYSF